jgi:hypothetical protein
MSRVSAESRPQRVMHSVPRTFLQREIVALLLMPVPPSTSTSKPRILRPVAHP